MTGRDLMFVVTGLAIGGCVIPMTLVAALANSRIPSWMKAAQWTLAAFFAVLSGSFLWAGLVGTHTLTDAALLALTIISIVKIITLVPACVEYIRIFRTRPG